ncbi:MAG: glycogen debranching enzyme GlgX [Spirochaetes bacterium RBG_16_49_21]|nr:MAG: glycogen debranching enzyme GlgX [Spirochaetes bacterium RBG_16_49_21]
MSGILRNITVSPGSPLPLGANFTPEGIQFSIFSRNAARVDLLFFESELPDSKYGEIHLDGNLNRTGDIWHVLVKGLREGQVYGYKIDGPYNPEQGHRFNRHKLLIDPYARAITACTGWDFSKALGYDPDSPDLDLSLSTTDSTPYAPKCIALNDVRDQGSGFLRIPERDYIIYELHVKGFTFHKSSKVKERGTFKGLAEKIPYLKELGITAVELMPVQEFNEEDNANTDPATGERLKNFWGYNTIAFFSPKGAYSSSGCAGEQVSEFRDTVRCFHDAGIEVILDVVFNHTAEGDETGATISFRGIDNSIYYILNDDKRRYKNFSGCGNTFNCNHPLVRNFILDVLRYWVIYMNIDGFRFDLASILGRDQNGAIMKNAPLIERIGEDPILRNTKIIAEAWDAAGAYQVGGFPGRWAEWNGKYRDDVRKFWRGDAGSVENFATRVTGSSDLYQKSGKGPLESINFITCHDGFTLNDLVSYKQKHNLANGEDNLDGETYNYSSNWGIEGPDSTPFITGTRLRMIKNFIATLFLSQGVPMFLAGDEFRRTQMGNNNAYCQDNETSWVDWDLMQGNKDLWRFTREMIRFRKNHPVLRRENFFTGTAGAGKNHPDITWHGHEIDKPDWGPHSRSIAMLINGEYADIPDRESDADLYLIFNASLISRDYSIPNAPSGGRWRVAIDTSNASPDDIFGPGMEPHLHGDRYFVNKLSTVVLITD